MAVVYATSGTSMTNPGGIFTQVECIGDGGGGAWGNGTSGQGTSGGGGGYGSTLNPGNFSASITVLISQGGTVNSSTGVGTAGGGVAFGASTVAAATTAANGGAAGLSGSSTGSAAGGTGKGGTTHTGGSSGNTPSYNTSAANICGAGGAAGPNGVGGTGGAGAVTTKGSPGGGGNGGGGTGGTVASGTTGASGGTAQDSTAGGTGGAVNTQGGTGSHGSGGGGSGTDSASNVNGGVGGAGVDWDATHGSGGGGGGGSGTASTVIAGVRTGGNYGGGGAGVGNNVAVPSSTYTAGAPGIIRLTFSNFDFNQNDEYIAFLPGSAPSWKLRGAVTLYGSEVFVTGTVSGIPTSAFNWDYQYQPFFQPPYLRFKNFDRGDEGVQYPQINWFNAGWEIQSHQPPHRIFKSPDVGDLGIQYLQINWFNAGWEIQSVQPPHQRFKNLDDGDKGIQAPSIVASKEFGHDAIYADLRRIRRVLADLGDPAGIDARFINWINSGWEIQSVQPPHRVYKSPETGDVGTQSPFILWLNDGWAIQYQDIKHPLYRSPDIGSSAAEFPPTVAVPIPLNWGFELQSGWQPPLWRLQRLWAALSQWEDGIEFPFIFVPPPIPPLPPPPPQLVLSGAKYSDMAVLGYNATQTMYWDFSQTENFYLLNAVGDGLLYRVTPFYARNWFLDNMGTAGFTEVFNPFRGNWFAVPSNVL